MLKHLTYISLLALLLTLGACASDEPTPAPNDADPGTVRYTATIPAPFATRAYDQGTDLQWVMCATYLHMPDGSTQLYGTPKNFAVKHNTDGTITADIDLKLLIGQTYDFLFFASAYDVIGGGTSVPYTFDSTSRNIQINYDGILNSDGQRDAFFAADLGVYIPDRGTTDRGITLRRPFASVNFGTNDLNNTDLQPYLANLLTKLTTTSCTKLNLATGIASDPTQVEYGFNSIPAADTEIYPVEGYRYIGMAYVLPVGPGTSQTDVMADFMAYSGQKTLSTIHIDALPLERNYRTNIYGSLITSSANWKILIDNGLNPSDFTVIHTADELQEAFNAGGSYTLASDVNLSQTNATIPTGVTLVLNLAANLTQSSTFTTLTNNGNTTILIGDGKYIELKPNSFQNNGNLTVQGGEVRVPEGATSTGSQALFTHSSGRLVMTDVTFNIGNNIAIASYDQNFIDLTNVTINTTSPKAMELTTTTAIFNYCNIQNTVWLNQGNFTFDACNINGGTANRAIYAADWSNAGTDVTINSGTYYGADNYSPNNAVYAIGTGTTLRVNGGIFQQVPIATSATFSTSGNSGNATLVLPAGREFVEVPGRPGYYQLSAAQ